MVGDELVEAVLRVDQVDVARLEERAAALPGDYALARWCDPVPEPLVG